VWDAAAPTLEKTRSVRPVRLASTTLVVAGATMELARPVQATAGTMQPTTLAAAEPTLALPHFAQQTAPLANILLAARDSVLEVAQRAQGMLSTMLITVWAALAPILGLPLCVQIVALAAIILPAPGPPTELAVLVPGLAQAIH